MSKTRRNTNKNLIQFTISFYNHPTNGTSPKNKLFPRKETFREAALPFRLEAAFPQHFPHAEIRPRTRSVRAERDSRHVVQICKHTVEFDSRIVYIPTPDTSGNAM